MTTSPDLEALKTLVAEYNGKRWCAETARALDAAMPALERLLASQGKPEAEAACRCEHNAEYGSRIRNDLGYKPCPIHDAQSASPLPSDKLRGLVPRIIKQIEFDIRVERTNAADAKVRQCFDMQAECEESADRLEETLPFLKALLSQEPSSGAQDPESDRK